MINSKDLMKSFEEKLGKAVISTRHDRIKTDVGSDYSVIWIELERQALSSAVKHLAGFQYPHLATISGKDLGDEIELIYHFSIGYGSEGGKGEVSVNLRVKLPKSDPKIQTITDIIPGALTAEREKIEFLGVEIEGIPNGRNIFLPYDMKEHPWRKDFHEK
jgi:membrane-bound hydrogenase subunit beta